MLSSVPSIEFEIPHFRNNFATISAGISLQDFTTHSQTVDREGRFKFPFCVVSLGPFIIHSFQYFLTWLLKGLLRETSNGCSIDVHPPGMTACRVLLWDSKFFTLSVRCARNWSQTSNDLLPSNAPGLENHTSFNHFDIIPSSTQPLGCTYTRTPSGNFSLGMVFRLKTTAGLSLVTSAKQAKMTVKWVFSWPEVLIETVLSPIMCTVELPGRSKNMGVSSIFPILEMLKSNCFLSRITNCWNDNILFSTSAGSFWAIWVLWRNVNPNRFIKREHHPMDALNSVVIPYLESFANWSALILIPFLVTILA